MFSLEKDLIEKAKKISPKFYKIIKSSLKVKNEQILIISDYGEKNRHLAPIFALGYYFAAKNKEFNVELLLQENKKGFMHSEKHISKALIDLPKNSIVILSLSRKLGRFGDQKSFRNFCKESGHRFISATGLGDAKTSHLDIFMEAIDTNYNRMKKKGLTIKKKLDKAKIIEVRTDAGTNLTFNVEDKIAIANIGEHYENGTGGNIPAGEVYIPPKGYYGVNGVAVIDGSIKTSGGAILLKEPIIIYIEEGKVVRMEGKDAKFLEETFQKFEDRARYPYRVRYVGELGIGINPGAVLMGSTIIDEKVLGTAHIAIGSNSWFGGDIKTIFHGDLVFKSPRIYLDGEKLEI
jgi:aminopeptidase